MSNTQLYTQFSWTYSFPDTTDDTDVTAVLMAHVLQWAIDNPSYALQMTTIQYDIIRAPAVGGPYGQIIWYARAV